MSTLKLNVTVGTLEFTTNEINIPINGTDAPSWRDMFRAAEALLFEVSAKVEGELRIVGQDAWRSVYRSGIDIEPVFTYEEVSYKEAPVMGYRYTVMEWGKVDKDNLYYLTRALRNRVNTALDTVALKKTEPVVA